MERMQLLWKLIREVSGDDAYERYVMHFRLNHADEGEPLSRQAFFKQQQDEKWKGIKRCC